MQPVLHRHALRFLLVAATLTLSACGGGSSQSGSNTAPTTNPPVTPPNAPSAPTGLAALAGDGQVELSWDPVAGATLYHIYWSTSSGVTPQTGTMIAGATSPYRLTNLVNGTPYFFVVTAENADGEGLPSGAASATPTAPVVGWGPQVLISVPFDFFDTDLYLGDVDINDQGESIAVWVREGSDSDTARVMANQYRGGAWSTSEALTGLAAFAPQATIATAGDVVVCYLQRGFDADGFRLNHTVWCTRYANASWSAAVQIDGVDLADSTYMHGIDTAVDANGNVVAVWIQDNSSIWTNRFDAAAGNWGMPMLLSTSVRNVQPPAVGVDGLGNFTVVWLQDTLAFDPGQSGGGPSQPTLYTSRYSGGSWSTATRIGHTDLADFDSAERVAIAVNADGTAVAVWEQARVPLVGDPAWSVDTIRYESGNWGAPESIVTQAAYTSWPTVAIDAAGNTVVAWQPTDPIDRSQRLAKASFYDALTDGWSAAQDINVDSGTGDVNSVRIGMDAAGNAIAVWIQDGAIQSRGYDAGGMVSSIATVGLRDGANLAFAMSGTGNAVVLTDLLNTSDVPFTRSSWASVYTP